MSVGWDGLEFQLRALPGVVAAWISLNDNGAVVQLLLGAEADEFELRRLVADLTHPLAGRPVSVEIARIGGAGGRPTPSEHLPRVRLTGVWTEALSGTVRVELARGDRVGDGSSVDAGARAGAEATLAALGALGANLAFSSETAAGAISDSDGHLVEVALQDLDGTRRFGIARADSVEVAAARATLHALNRYLGKEPVDQPSVDQPSVDQPSVDQPSVDQPYLDRPYLDRPADDRPRSYW